MSFALRRTRSFCNLKLPSFRLIPDKFYMRALPPFHKKSLREVNIIAASLLLGAREQFLIPIEMSNISKINELTARRARKVIISLEEGEELLLAALGIV